MSKKTINLIEATLDDFVAHLRPDNPSVLEQLNYGWKKEKLGYNLFEIRPHHFPEFLKEGAPEKLESPFARIRYYKTREEFELFWMRASGKWEFYEPHGVSTHLEELFNVIIDDMHGCFFG